MEVQSFDSWEDMQEAMQEAHDQWTVLTTEGQKVLQDGQAHWWFQWENDYKIAIWGERWSLEHYAEYLRGRAAEQTDPESAQKWLDDIENDKVALARGYIFGMAYSEIEPTGELGSTHVSQMVEVPRETWELARSYDWDIKAMLDDPVSRSRALSVTSTWNAMIVERFKLGQAFLAKEGT